jgi:PTH1 family peptidyl-tRNA hydrolase
MNLSGEAAQALADFYSIEVGDIAVVYDELSIPFGQIRSRIGGQAAGHNGVKSLIEHLGDEFGRVRIGIKNSSARQTEATDFVLNKLNKNEQAVLDILLGEVSGLLTEFIFGNAIPQDTRRIDTR